MNGTRVCLNCIVAPACIAAPACIVASACIVALVCIVGSPLIVLAQHETAISEDDAVEAGRDALAGGPRLPWYDRKQDDLERVRVRSVQDAEHRDSDWLAKQRQANQPSNWSVNFWAGVMSAMNIVFWIVLAIILVGLVFLLVRSFLRSEGTPVGVLAPSSSVEADAARIEKLPFQVKRPQSDLLGEARANYERGNFAEAIVYLFSYQLVQLDKHHLIRLTKGKTNRQYLREVRRFGGITPMLQRTMISFEDVFFGHHELRRDEFEACWSQLDQFHSLVQEASQ